MCAQWGQSVMARILARLAALFVVGLASLWYFVPMLVREPIERKPPPRYPTRGLTFHYDSEGRAAAIQLWYRYEPRRGITWSDPPSRPGENEIVPGVGACEVQLRDRRQTVLEALGSPLQEHRYGEWCELVYRDLLVRLEDDEVEYVTTSRAGARAADGIGVGSTRQEVEKAYGAPEDDMRAAYGHVPDEGGGEITRFPWHTEWAGAVFGSLALSIPLCLVVTLLHRKRGWMVVLLTCLVIWLVAPPLRLCQTVVKSVPLSAETGSLDDFCLSFWRWYEGDPKSQQGFGAHIRQGAIESFKQWLRKPIPSVTTLATLLGFFAIGRLVSGRLRNAKPAARLLAVAGGLVLGLMASGLWFMLGPGRPPIYAAIWGAPRWNPLTSVVLPNAILLGCLLLVASQTPWSWRALWRPTAIDAEPEPCPIRDEHLP